MIGSTPPPAFSLAPRVSGASRLLLASKVGAGGVGTVTVTTASATHRAHASGDEAAAA